MRPAQLWNKRIGAINRTREQCRKESDIGSKLHHILTWFDMLTMNLYYVADQLERKETHTNRYDDVQSCPRSLQSNGIKQLCNRLTKEIQIFEVEQQTDTQGYAKSGQMRSLLRTTLYHHRLQPKAKSVEYCCST